MINGIIMLPIAVLLLYCLIKGVKENIRISCEDEPQKIIQKPTPIIEAAPIAVKPQLRQTADNPHYWDGYLAGSM